MVPPDAYVKAFTALFTGVLASLLLIERRSAPSAWILGIFLLLIGLNSAAEAARALSSDPREQLVWFRVASISAALDPIALYWFAASHPRPNDLGRWTRLGSVLAIGATLALYAGWVLPATADPTDPSSENFPLALTAYTIVVYLIVLLWAIQCFRKEPRDRGWRSIVPAFAIVAIPAVGGRLVDRLIFFGGPSVYASAPWLLAGLVLVVAIAELGIFRTLRREPEVRRVVRGSLYLAAALVALVRVSPSVVGHMETAFRWVLFGAFASMAVFRGQALGWSLHARRRAARLFLGSVFLLLAGLLVLAIQNAVTFTLADAALLLVALALSQGFGKLVDEVALRLYGVPKPGDAETAKNVYQRAAGEALAMGREPARDAELQRLREELSIDARTASLLERLAEDELPGPIAPGRLVLGRYAVQRLLGRGSGGRAFLAHDTTLDRDVVLKEVLSSGDEEDALREARAAGSLRHPNIVTVHDVIRRAGASYLVTEYVEGGSLAEQAPLDASRAIPRVLGLLDGLAAVHERGIIHRDIKPHNVLVTRDGSWKLADFGIASHPGTASATKALLGTPEYMAPEQKRGERVTPASDVYAVGLLARRVIQAPLPAALDAIIQRATRERADERYANAGELAAAIREISLPSQ